VTGGGVSTFYFGQEQGDTTGDALNDLFVALGAWVPNDVTWTIQQEGDLINDADGSLQGTWSDGPDFNVIASSAGAHAQGVGTYIRWDTAGINHGRRVKGRTFVVPLITAAWDTAGVMGGGPRGVISSAASAFRGALGDAFLVWSRPTASGPGMSFPTVGSFVPTTPSWLRTRRT